MTHPTKLSASPPVEASTLIRQFRQLLGLTQEQFAARMGVTLVTVNRWENNRSKPSPLAWRRIKTMLADIAQSSDTGRADAHELLNRFFQITSTIELHDRSDR